MNRKKKLLAALLGAAIISSFFTACSSGTTDADSIISKEQTPKGGYVETDITPPNVTGTPRGLWASNDGSIYYWVTNTNNNKQELYRSSNDGATWLPVDLSWSQNQNAGLIQLAVTDSGNYFAITLGSALFEVWKVNQGAGPIKVPVSDLEEVGAGGKTLSPMNLVALNEDNFLLEYMTIQQQPSTSGSATDTDSEKASSAVDSNGNPASEISTESASDTSVNFSKDEGSATHDFYQTFTGIYNIKGELVKKIENQQRIRAVTKNNQALFFMDYVGIIQATEISTGNLLTQYANIVDISNLNQAFAVDKNNNAYLASDKGIERLAPSGSLAETLLEGDMYSFGSPSVSVKNLCCTKDESFILACCLKKGRGRLYRYIYDATISSAPKSTMTVWSLKDNQTVRAAITVFQKQNKDIRINYEVALTKEDSSAGTQDVQRALNTELLAGKGPDVIIFDGLDYQSYRQKGLLIDLSKQIDTSGLYQNVIKPFQGSDGLYVLPTRFSMPLLFGNKSGLDALNSLQDITATIEKAPPPKQVDVTSENYNKAYPEDEQAAFSFDDLRDAFDFLYNVSEPAVIDSNGIQEEALRQLLNSVKIISDKYSLADGTKRERNKFGIGLTSGGELTGVLQLNRSLWDYAKSHTLYGSSNFSTLAIMQFIVSSNDNGEPDAKLMPGLNKGSYYPSTMAGINAKSSKQKEAMELIDAMLSDEVQSFALGDGLPVMQNGMRHMIDTYNKETYNKKHELLTLNMDINSLVSQVATPININTTIGDIIFKQAERYCKGEISIDDAIKAINTETEIFIAEKK